MDKVTRYEWHGNRILLMLMCLIPPAIPLAVVYFMSNLLSIETQVPDGTNLSEFLRSKE